MRKRTRRQKALGKERREEEQKMGTERKKKTSQLFVLMFDTCFFTG